MGGLFPGPARIVHAEMHVHLSIIFGVMAERHVHIEMGTRRQRAIAAWHSTATEGRAAHRSQLKAQAIKQSITRCIPAGIGPTKVAQRANK